MPINLAHLPADCERQHTRRSLTIAVVVSVVLHSVLLAFAPGFVEERQAPVRLGVLEVVLRMPAERTPSAPEPALEPAPPARARLAAQSRPWQSEIATVATQPASRTGPGVALPGISDSWADPDRLPVASSARASAPLAAAPAEKPAAAEAPIAPAVVSAAYLNSPAPRYPDAARRLGQEGTVTLRVLVTADGIPARVALERSSGSAHLDGAALERVRNWRLRPARQGSAPVESWVIVPIVFRLESAS